MEKRNAYPAHIESNRATYHSDYLRTSYLLVLTLPFHLHAVYVSLSKFDSSASVKFCPKDKVVVEILETCKPTDDLLEAVKDLYQAGYMIALDDFTSTPEWERFLNTRIS